MNRVKLPINSIKLFADVFVTTFASRKEIEKKQRRRLNEIVLYAKSNSPFYKQLYKDIPASITNTIELPYVTKPQLMAKYDSWVTDPKITLKDLQAFTADKTKIGTKFLERYSIWTTSGSTGIPTIVLHDFFELQLFEIISKVRGLMTRLTPLDLWKFYRRGRRTASLFAVGGHLTGPAMVKNAMAEHERYRNRVKMISVLKPIEEIVEQLNSYQPTILSGFAAMHGLLAEEQLEGRLHIDPVLILATAERLTKDARANIIKAYPHAKLCDNYGSTETALLAVECRYGRKHYNADWYIVEPVDKDYNPVPPGVQSCSTLITNLANYTQPFIRYEVGDCTMIYKDKCKCGSNMPSLYVEGRTNEVLKVKNFAGETVRLIPMLFVDVIGCAPGVYRYQVIQREPTKLTIRLEAKKGMDEHEVWKNVKNRLQSFLNSQGLEKVGLEKSNEVVQRNAMTGKFHHVWSEMV